MLPLRLLWSPVDLEEVLEEEEVEGQDVGVEVGCLVVGCRRVVVEIAKGVCFLTVTSSR